MACCTKSETTCVSSRSWACFASSSVVSNKSACISLPLAMTAAFVGFTGTPITETYQTFGDEIDRYTMDQAVSDGLTVSIKYHPRIAKVLLDNQKVQEVEEYYKKCADDGTSEDNVEASVSKPIATPT